ncbi:nucleotide-binding universal stress UspA family protein [Streptomyces aurantiacus]|uniref:universal stress protein n=1 Tax=Streptomyces aurantiacus TaxID=47760 RepID=UPI002791B06B|nr:universal stress protein [Streptomyces aurantiacus]MDQ0779931.1 nucleotide-binding universal stress UspA family protein [Streptomyces aurantiacus]
MGLHDVVVGVDGSVIAVRALDRAAEDAVRRDAVLRVVYAVFDPDEAGPVLASAAARVRARHPGLRVVTRAVRSGPVPALVRESEDAALTVVGTRGLNAIAGRMLGSVSLRLAAHARGPLMVVRDDHPCDRGGPAPGYSRERGDTRPVLLGVESDADADADAAGYAFQEAQRRGVRLNVLHASARRHTTPELPSLVPATSPGQQRQIREERAEEAVSRFALARLEEKYPEVGVDARTVDTAPTRALLEATRDASVVVLGAHRHTARFGPRPGPVTHTLLHRSHCPVLLVPITT